MHGGSCESTTEAFEWHEAKPSASLAFRVLSQLPKCIVNSIDAQLKHGPFLLEHCHFKRKLINYRILLNHSEHFDWLNAITRFDRACVYRDLDARSRHTKSAQKIVSYVLKPTCATGTTGTLMFKKKRKRNTLIQWMGL